MPILAKFNAHLAQFLLGRRAASLAGVLFGSVVLALTASRAAYAAAPVPWQMDLQPPAGSLAEMATDLHNLLLVVITLISLFVLGLLIYVGVRFRASRNPNPSKTSHHTVIGNTVDGYSGADSGWHCDTVIPSSLLHGSHQRNRHGDQGYRQSVVLELHLS